MPITNPYYTIIEKLKQAEGDSERRAIASALVEQFSSESTNMIQQHDMSQPEPMYSVQVAGVRVNYRTKDNRTLDAIGNIAALFPATLDTLDKWTSEVTLATKPAALDPSGIATSGAGDARIVVYGSFTLDRVTLVHEIAHNFIDAVLTGYSDLSGSPYQDAVDEELPSPYPQGGASLQEDFAESTALFLLDPTNFKAHWPRRAALIESMLTWEPE